MQVPHEWDGTLLGDELTLLYREQERQLSALLGPVTLLDLLHRKSAAVAASEAPHEH